MNEPMFRLDAGRRRFAEDTAELRLPGRRAPDARGHILGLGRMTPLGSTTGDR